MIDTTKTRERIEAMVRRGAKITDLAEKVLGLQTHDKLLLAATLLVVGDPKLAKTVAQRAVDEIQLALLFAERKDA